MQPFVARLGARLVPQSDLDTRAMEWGESPSETALRELAEETGLTAKVGSVAGVFSRWTPHRSRLVAKQVTRWGSSWRPAT